MKRALIVLLLLAVAGGLFAQISFGGHVRSGLVVAVPDEGDPAFGVYNPDPNNAFRFELNGAYTNADANAGANLRFRMNETAWGGEYAYAWFKPLDILWLYGGKMDNNRWGTFGGYDASGDVGSPTGFHLRLDPVPGASLGVGIAPALVDGVWGEFADASYRFGVRYTASGLLDAAANIAYNGASEVTNANAGVNILALASAGFSRLAIDVAVRNLGDAFDTTGTFGVGPRIEFKVGDLSGGLRAQVYIPVVDGQDLDTAATVWGSYPIGSITARLGAGFELKGGFKAANSTGTFDYREWDALPKAIGGADDPLVVVKPSLAFNIGGGTIEAGYSLMTQLGDDSATKHAIYTTFNVGF